MGTHPEDPASIDSNEHYMRIDPEIREQLDRIESKLDRVLEAG